MTDTVIEMKKRTACYCYDTYFPFDVQDKWKYFSYVGSRNTEMPQ